MKTNSIVWFRQDLRVLDNPPLYYASLSSNILPVYVFDNEIPKKFKIGGAQRWWLYKSLKSLNISLNQNLHIVEGESKKQLANLCKKFNISDVYFNKCYEPWRLKKDKELCDMLNNMSVKTHIYNGSLLWNPLKINKDDKSPYKVFTPFYRKGCLNQKHPRKPYDIPVTNFIKNSSSVNLDELNLLPKNKWYKKLERHWDVSEKGALNKLDSFLKNGILDYKNGRNYPSKRNVSHLSPYLHFGQISPNKIWHDVSKLPHDENVSHFKSELGWREFSYYLLFHNPTIKENNIQSKFDKFPWIDNNSYFKKWKAGETGVPIVDAGMRQLWNTGYIHNRVRMIVGSFLVKNLLLDWRLGEEWFNECLVDADNASNSASWQWIAGCGADAAPYFRIFNPVTQGIKFDEYGEYTKEYVPELRDVPIKYLFSPWECPNEILGEIGLRLGIDYPNPIVNLKESRNIALDAFSSLKNEN